ncbi:MAG: bifunctional 4-hydroxy-2-oxoglutarate aldolase/2-dehydro-3-deoxy-phosphogluconate aldolase [Acidimicrobiales bacterium]
MDVIDAIRADKVVAVIRADRVADPAGLVATLVDAGIRCVEFTFTTPGVLDAIREAAETGNGIVGAGTVLRPEQADQAIAAGAQFVVSPVVRTDLAHACVEHRVPVFLGALSPTEVLEAREAGVTAVKLFPASLGGPSYLKDLRAPFPDITFLPSGGIDEEAARAFLAAGAAGVYVGSRVAPPDLVANGQHKEVLRRAQAFVAALGEPPLESDPGRPPS